MTEIKMCLVKINDQQFYVPEPVIRYQEQLEEKLKALKMVKHTLRKKSGG